jgi:mannose-1-phosphate guanylyltransferase
VYVGPGAVVEEGARAGSLAVLGAGSTLARGAIVEGAVIGARASVGAGSVVTGSIVGDDAAVGAACEVRNLSVVGPGASLGSGNALDHGLRIGAGQEIPDRALRFS